MNVKKTIIYSLIFFLYTLQLFGNKIEFNYGGLRGKKYGGKLEVEYLIKSGNQINKIDISEKINLNNYKQPVEIGIKISNVQLGLSKDGSKMKFDEHPKVFFIQAAYEIKNKNGEVLFSSPMDSVSAVGGHYRDYTILTYEIQSETDSLFNIYISPKLQVKDSHYSREWIITQQTKSFSFIPKINEAPIEIEKTESSNINSSKTSTNKNYSGYSKSHSFKNTSEDKNIKIIEEILPRAFEISNKEVMIEYSLKYLRNCDKMESEKCDDYESVYCLLLSFDFQDKQEYQEKYIELYKNGVCFEKVNKQINEQKHWELYNEIKALVSNKDTSLNKLLEKYLINYQTPNNLYCDALEDVLFWKILNNNKETKQYKNSLFDYLVLFPSGKHTKSIERFITQLPEPINNKYTEIDFDENAFIVNKIKGGKKPYIIEFYNHEINSSKPIVTELFNTAFYVFEFNCSQNIPDGLYNIIIKDHYNNVFVKTANIPIYQKTSISNKYLILLVGLLVLSFFYYYKKYIQF